jgi:hypothetical protein
MSMALSLSKKMISIKNHYGKRGDLSPFSLIEQLEKGEIVGDKIPGVKYSVFKVRILNSDIQKAKSENHFWIFSQSVNYHILP